MLTDAQIRRAKPDIKPVKLSDSGGLFLLISTAGSKLWRLKYRFSGKEKLLSLGAYPEVSLIEARNLRDQAKEVLKAGRDPSVAKKLSRLAGKVSQSETFKEIATEWHRLNSPQWAPRHSSDVITSLENEIFPVLGDDPIRNITPSEVLAVLRPVEARGAKETARRIRQRMSAVFVYAIASGRADADPAAVVMKAMAPLIKGRQPAVTTLKAAREVLAAVEAQTAHPATKLAHRLLALTALRPGTLITTPWDEVIDLGGEDALWQVPASRMKLKAMHKDDEARDHLVPLSRQALRVIEAIRPLSGKGIFVFPNARHSHKPMSENAIGYLLNRADFHHKHVPHGWRATFSSVMNELFPADKPVIDLMLAHVPKDKVEGAYNRAKHLKRRAELSQAWADLLLEGAPDAEELLSGPRRRSRRLG